MEKSQIALCLAIIVESSAAVITPRAMWEYVAIPVLSLLLRCESKPCQTHVLSHLEDYLYLYVCTVVLLVYSYMLVIVHLVQFLHNGERGTQVHLVAVKSQFIQNAVSYIPK